MNDDRCGRTLLMMHSRTLVSPAPAVSHCGALEHLAAELRWIVRILGTAGSLISMRIVLPLTSNNLVVVPACHSGSYDSHIADKDNRGILDFHF